VRIGRAKHTGFCFGVRRAIDMTEKAARENGGIQTLGAIVHNEQVQRKLAECGVEVVKDLAQVKGGRVVISAHGVSPEREADIRGKVPTVVDTTCPFVHRAQLAARKLVKNEFFVIVYGEAEHPEVKGILGYAGANSLATTDIKAVVDISPRPRRIGILSQTTQIPAFFIEFNQKLMAEVFGQDSEIHVIDTICHDIRERQAEALRLAQRSDLMLVVGGKTSANTNHLAQLCARYTETHRIETADDIQSEWLSGKGYVGVTSGSSTAESTIDEVMERLAGFGGEPVSG